MSITDEASLNAAADALLATGLRRVFISLGGDGVFAAEAQPPAKMPLPGDKGAGDPSGDFKSAIDKLFS